LLPRWVLRLPATVFHLSSAEDIAFNAAGGIWFRRWQIMVSIVFRDGQAELDIVTEQIDYFRFIS
jgi:hypothetical protein